MENNDSKSLYFVNFGGYKPGYFVEIHEINFYACASKTEAVAKAKTTLCALLNQQHCDDNLLVEDLIQNHIQDIDGIAVIKKIDQYYLHLIPTEMSQVLNVEAHYRKLNLPDILEKAEKLKQQGLVEINV